jgi:thymidylate synthase
MNNLDKQYQNLITFILENGIKKADRTGTGTISVFDAPNIIHNMKEGFPLLTTKELDFNKIISELMWFLKGETHIKYLLDRSNNIWIGDAYKNFKNKTNSDISKKTFIFNLKNDKNFVNENGELGRIYGYQWRNFNGNYDQINELIQKLKNDPDSRRLVVTAWNPTDLPYQVLPPCHILFQVYTSELTTQQRLDIFHEKFSNTILNNSIYLDDFNIPKRSISLKFYMRSNDVGLGLPYNLASYGLLLSLLGKHVNMIPDKLIYTCGDTHIYLNHVDGLTTQLNREPYKLPILSINPEKKLNIDEYDVNDFNIINYQSHPHIKLELSN